MAKRTFASALPVITIILLSAHSPASLADDGCTILQELVKTSVYVSATEFAPDRPVRVATTERPGATASTLGGSQTCLSAAQATSRAFGESLAALGMPITWNGSPMNPGEHCLSHDLNQCYPSQHPFSPALPPNHLNFIYDAWTGVRKGVISQMPLGTAAGVVQFTPESLDAALASGMKAYVDGPLYSSYQGPQVGRPRIGSR